MLCYVGGTVRKYYYWEDNEWKDFTTEGGGSGNTAMFRVTTYEDLLALERNFTLEMGALAHVSEDIYEKYLYYYGVNGWTSVRPTYQVWIGNTPPSDKRSLWIDTRNDYDEASIDNIPTFIDTELIQYLVNQIRDLNTNYQSQINALQSQIDEINRRIESGEIIVNPGEDNSTYVITEDGYTIITEDGYSITTEDSDNSGGGSTTDNNYITTEDGYIITTENGSSIITEDGKSDSSGSEETMIISYDATTSTLTIESSAVEVVDGNLIINNSNATVSNGNLNL